MIVSKIIPTLLLASFLISCNKNDSSDGNPTVMSSEPLDNVTGVPQCRNWFYFQRNNGFFNTQ